jgi:hypothetical protein
VLQVCSLSQISGLYVHLSPRFPQSANEPMALLPSSIPVLNSSGVLHLNRRPHSLSEGNASADRIGMTRLRYVAGVFWHGYGRFPGRGLIPVLTETPTSPPSTMITPTFQSQGSAMEQPKVIPFSVVRETKRQVFRFDSEDNLKPSESRRLEGERSVCILNQSWEDHGCRRYHPCAPSLGN